MSQYINNKFLEELIIKFKKAKKDKDSATFEQVQHELCQGFYILSTRIIQTFKFEHLEEEDMMQECVLTCLKKIDKYDPTFVNKNGVKSKAFNYFTTCIINVLRLNYRSSKKYAEFKTAYSEFRNKTNPNT